MPGLGALPDAHAVSAARRVAAEALGTAGLLVAVVGSGIMGERLAGGNEALALLANALATGGALWVLIALFAPISGAHFNPLVSLLLWRCGKLSRRAFLAYLPAQVVGAAIGVIAAHAMFGLPLLQFGDTPRATPGFLLGEFIATFGLVFLVLGALGRHGTPVAGLVAAYIASAYWFTSSTSFANPAVTLARALTASFAGIAPASIPGFVAAQVLGALAAGPAAAWLFQGRRSRDDHGQGIV